MAATAELEAALEERFEASVRSARAFFRDAAPAVAACSLAMARAFARGARLITFGSGAAATDAMHEAVEFVHPVVAGWRALPALALPCDVATVTGGPAAEGDPERFVGPLVSLARPGDIAMGLATGAPGPEIRAALAAAKRRGLLTVAVTGAGAPDGLAEHAFVVPGEDLTVVQEVQETLYHVFWEVVHTFFQHPGLVRGPGPAGGGAGPDPRAGSDGAAGAGESPELRLLYPYLFGDDAVDPAAVMAEVQRSILDKAAEVCRLRQEVLAASGAEILEAARAMAERMRRGGKLLAFGNGGSATDAADVTADFLRPPVPGRRPLPALSLVADPSILTAVANDVSFADVFSRQILAYAAPEDIALGLSTSGTSGNVLAAFAEARRRGLLTVGLAGYDGGEMAQSPDVDWCITVPSTYVPRIQEVQATVYHTLWELVHRALESDASGGVPVAGRSAGTEGEGAPRPFAGTGGPAGGEGEEARA